MTPNPYQAPLAESFSADQGVEPGAFIPRRMEFHGELTRRHHTDAVSKAGIRKEYRNPTRVMVPLACLFALLAGVLLLASNDLGPLGLARVATSIVVFAFGVLVFCLHQRWLLGTRMPSLQLICSSIRGWIDGNGLWIHSETIAMYCPLAMLVSCAATEDIWVLSFGKDQTFWQTIPIDAFDDPPLARSVASDLQRNFPPKLAQAPDERKWHVPEEPFRFSAAAEAVEFEGNFYEDCADGTRLVTATRNVTRRSWLVLAVLLGSILMSLLLLTGFRTLYVFLALLWIAFLCINLYVRLWRARRHSREQGRPIAWYSKGWLDEAGYCAMTTLGQSHAAWKFFDHYEITDRAIGLYPHDADICCCLIGREQFASPQDWQRATDLVVRMMRSTPN